MRNCKECGESINHRIHSAKFCNHECYTKSRNKLKEMFKRNCKKCDVSFETYYPDKIFCTHSCANGYGRSQKREVVSCGRCDVEFTPKTKLHKFCSYRCRTGDKPAKVKYCRTCGITMEPMLGGPQNCDFCQDTIDRHKKSPT